MAGRNRTAVDLTIDALRHLGRLDQIDESLPLLLAFVAAVLGTGEVSERKVKKAQVSE